MTTDFIPYTGKTLNRLQETIGQKYGKLTITEIIGQGKRRKLMIRALCECGNTIITAHSDVKRMHTRSCGCLKHLANRFVGETKHGESNTKKKRGTCEYFSWAYIRRYWISVKKEDNMICDRWKDEKNGYLNFLEDMGRKPSPKSKIRRHDRSKAFGGDNCYWKEKGDKYGEISWFYPSENKNAIQDAVIYDVKNDCKKIN